MPNGGWQSCRYCGLPWRPWAGTKLDGHAVCVVPPHVQDFAYHLASTGCVTTNRLAVRFSVSPSTVMAWLNAAMWRRHILARKRPFFAIPGWKARAEV